MTTSARTKPAPVEAAAPRPTTRRRIHWRDIGANWLAFTVLVARWRCRRSGSSSRRSDRTSEVNASPPIWIPQRITLDAFDSLFGLEPGDRRRACP